MHALLSKLQVKQKSWPTCIRATPITTIDHAVGRSMPFSNCDAHTNKNDSTELNNTDFNTPACDNEKDKAGEEFCGYLDFADIMGDEDVEHTDGDLSDEDIDRLWSALFDIGDASQPGQTFLKCTHLSHPPDPKYMVDKYSSVLGDSFHAMDRTKVPIRHEARKGYFVALREAFFVWNPIKLSELEERMKQSGLNDEAIQHQRYFNTQLFRDCVDRSIPPPTTLYWRVRAVYATYGPLIDSKSKSPLFNAAAWRKADNLLKEILEGYYSDPPGFELYNIRLRADGTVMKNKYGMDIIECSRGTNRTEGYHKNVMVTFGSWSTGVEMSDCLLREKRHRHNQNVSEKRRSGYPRIGHYDTWLVDLLQLLVMKNHDKRIYPDLSNTSEYLFTDESFDTIALHSRMLDEAVRKRYSELDKRSIKLTGDQKYLCKVMGTPLPFLPFSEEKEYKAYARYVVDGIVPKDHEDAAIAFCPFIDGTNIFPKLPSHMRTHHDQWEQNQRVKESVRKVAQKNDKLKLLNEKIVPRCESTNSNRATIESGGNPIRHLEDSLPVLHVPTRNQIVPGGMIPMPSPQAIIHTSRSMIVGGVSIGNSLGSDGGDKYPRMAKKKGRPPGSKNVKGVGVGTRSCGRCGNRGCRGAGKPGRDGCEYMNEDGSWLVARI